MILDTFIKQRNSSKTIRIGSHILFWIVLFFSSYFLSKSSYDPYSATPLGYLFPLRRTLELILFFYPLMYVLIPYFFERKRWVPFILYLLLLLFFIIFIEAVGEKITFHYCDTCAAMAQERDPDYLSILQKPVLDNFLFKSSNIGIYFNLFSGLLLPIAIKSSLGYYQIHTRNLELEKEKVQLELNFLKAQVNPHFLFNTLNNLYGLILHDRRDASAETVTRLSDYLRYSLDNANKKSIPLSDEIELTRNYIELESLRLNHTNVSFTTQVDNTNANIPPLLFIPIVENAFKYNVDKKDTDIRINLSVNANTLQLKVENGFAEAKTKNDNGGLGLTNLKKRLDLHYSENYTYNMDIDNSVYKVSLKLVLA